MYYKEYPDDSWPFQYGVALLWILDILHVVISIHALYFYLVESFGNYLQVLTIIWSFRVGLFFYFFSVVDEHPELIPTAAAAHSQYANSRRRSRVCPSGLILELSERLTQRLYSLYALRVWKFGRHFHKVLPLSIFLAVVACLGAGIYGTYEMYTISTYLDIPSIRTAIYVVFSTAVAADFFIATTMCYYLHRGRSMTGFSSTTKIIVGLMRFAVMSGLTM
ncbi:hypothetical protein IW261DRAFT_1602343, partial [Armillaria novae-zelandiae]